MHKKYMYIAVGCLVPFTIFAQQPIEKPSNDEIAKQLANPNTPLATLRLKNQYTFYQGNLPGAGDQSNFSMLFQPSFPFPRENGDVVLFRPALPIFVDKPLFSGKDGSFESKSGLGDLAFDLAYGRTSSSGVLTAFGVVSTLPTASRPGLGFDQWLVGPELLIGKITENYVIGAFPNHQWDVAGEDKYNTSITSLQVFATWLPGGGWAIASSPIMQYDWEASQWTLPVNLTVSKTVKWGDTPYKLDFTLDYYVDQPEAFGPEWMIGFNVAPVVENIFASWLK